MFTGEIDGRKFRDIVKILRTVIGRSEEIFRNIFFDSGVISATDGCLRVFTSVSVPGKFAAPSDVIWALSKHSKGVIKVTTRKGSVKFESDGMELILEDKEALFPRKTEGKMFLGKFGKDFWRALDFVSRPLDEDDPVEVHFNGKVAVAVGKSGGITALYIFGESSGIWSGKIPYQSTRRFVKSFSWAKEYEIFGGEDLCVNAEGFHAYICCEDARPLQKLPDVDKCAIMSKIRLSSLLEKAHDVLGRAFVMIEASGGMVRLYGKRGGIRLRLEEKCSENISFRAFVPIRKFKSYISSVSSKSICVSVQGEMTIFTDRGRKRYVIAKAAI